MLRRTEAKYDVRKSGTVHLFAKRFDDVKLLLSTFPAATSCRYPLSSRARVLSAAASPTGCSAFRPNESACAKYIHCGFRLPPSCNKCDRQGSAWSLRRADLFFPVRRAGAAIVSERFGLSPWTRESCHLFQLNNFHPAVADRLED